jgi:hypothetical protein
VVRFGVMWHEKAILARDEPLVRSRGAPPSSYQSPGRWHASSVTDPQNALPRGSSYEVCPISQTVGRLRSGFV